MNRSTPQEGRNRRLLFAISSGFVGRAVAVIAPLVMVPILLSSLGEVRFGVWATVTSFTSMLVFADLGLGSGLLTRLSSAYGDGDLPQGRRLVSDSYIGLTAIAMVGMCAAVPILYFVDVADLLGVPAGQEADAGGIVAVIVSAFFVSMPLSLIGRIQLGVQQAWQTNMWASVGPAISVPIVWGLASSGAGPVMVVAGASVGPLLVAAANTLVFFNTRLGRSLRPSPRSASRAGARALLGLGSAFAALSVLSSVALNIDNVLIAATLGSAEVTSFAVAWRLLRASALLIAIVGMPLWGANGEALARGDLGWIRRITLMSALGLTSAAAAIASLLVVYRAQIIGWWVGPDLATPFWLYAGLGLWGVLVALVSPFFMVQNAAGLVRIQIAGWGAYLVLSVSAKLVGLNVPLGVEWVPWIGAACYAVTVVPSALIGYHWVMKAAQAESDAVTTERKKPSRRSA